MAFGRTTPLHRRVEWGALLRSARLSPLLAEPSRRAWLLQWTVVGVVSIVLGIFAIGAALLPSRLMPIAVLVALCPFAVAIVGDARKLFLGLIVLDLPLQQDVNLLFNLDAAKFGAVGGLSLSITTIALVVLYAMWLGELLTKAQTPARSLVRWSLPLALYTLFTALSLTVARDVELGSYLVFLTVQTFLLFAYIAGTVRSKDDVLFIVTLLLVGVFLEGAIILASQVLGRGGSAPIVTRPGATPASLYAWRSSGTLGSPNDAASYFSLLLAPAISILLIRGAQVGPWLKRFAALALVVGLPALVLTGSRGGLIALAVSGTIICLVAWWRGWLPKMALFTAAAVLLVALVAVPVVSVVPVTLPFQNIITNRLEAGDNGRAPLVDLAWQMIRDNPWLGVGANNFAIMIKDYATPDFSSRWLYIVHNRYLSIWAEAGIGALLAFLWFMGATIVRGWRGIMSFPGTEDRPGGSVASLRDARTRKVETHSNASVPAIPDPSKDRFLLPLILGFTAGVMAQAIHLSVDTFNDRAQTQQLWFVAALITVMSSMALSERSKVQSPESKAATMMALDSHPLRGYPRALDPGLPRKGH